MAYRDENGRITIDEDAAKRDIRNIDDAIASLDGALKAIENIMARAADQKGKAMTATINKANQLKKRISLLKNELNGNKDVIRGTVSKYRQIDAAIKAEIK